MTAIILLLCMVASTVSATFPLQEIYSWKAVDWNYPDEASKQKAISLGEIIPENALPVGIERWKNKLFITVPRWRPGIPATLNYISLDGVQEKSPNLNPYPNLAGNELGNCQTGLNTVYRIKADNCDRLWVLDVGTYGYDPNVTNLCPYALNIYDLKTDTRIRRYVFRPEDIVPTTFIANIALDMGHSCEDTFAYFSDELGYGLLVYSWEKNKSWRFDHGYFLPDPLLGDFNIGGLNFQWYTEGIFGITVSPLSFDGYSTLYFTPIVSNTEFAVSTRILRDETKVKGSYQDFRVVGTRGEDGHTTAKAMDINGVQLFSLIDQNSIGCWSSFLPYKPENIGTVARDDVGLIFPSDIKIDDERNVWVMSDRMPIFLEAELDYNDINFRIYIAPLDELVEDTVCDLKQHLHHSKPLDTVKVTPPHFGYGVNPPSDLYWSTIYSNSPVKTIPSKTSVTSYFPYDTHNIIQKLGKYDYNLGKHTTSSISTNIQHPKTILGKGPLWIQENYEVHEKL